VLRIHDRCIKSSIAVRQAIRTVVARSDRPTVRDRGEATQASPLSFWEVDSDDGCVLFEWRPSSLFEGESGGDFAGSISEIAGGQSGNRENLLAGA
jgi:hypothetical protein